MTDLLDSFMEHHPISPVGTTIKPDQLKAVQKEVRSLRTQLAACEKSLKTATDSWNFEAKKCNEAESQLAKANERVEELECSVDKANEMLEEVRASGDLGLYMDNKLTAFLVGDSEQLRKEQE